MTFFKIKSHFFFHTFSIVMILTFIFAVGGRYWDFTVIVVFVGVFSYLVRYNYLLKLVKEDRVVLNFSYVTIQVLFKDIKEVKLSDIGEINLFRDIDQFSIRTKKNKYYEVYYIKSSGDFEKIQEGVAKAQLQMGTLNTPE
ncbi:MAG: hypothetical protein BA863_08690 [Desulfovibrio sp. S3730MH75]|nr:MAG: hypothetical protein BA863_08690 [Desulfovibrio sp. S3730MH75]